MAVERVVGLVEVADADIGPPPLGQGTVAVSGAVRVDDRLVLVVDATVLAGVLGPAQPALPER